MEGAYVLSSNVDNRVVNMKFNNGEFEKNVSTSLNSIQKLKQSLKFDSVHESANSINNAFKGLDVGIVGIAVDKVADRFSALKTVAETVIKDMTQSVIDFGKALVTEIAIDPIKQGFEEYELKMGSVQNIMNGAGASLEEVNGVLAELNTYADRTIYSFSDMTSSIGKFTNAGVNLDDAVAAIKGISNEAALSGANAQQASHAMYNFAQALSSGSVKLIDWKSIENANMATVGFKDVLLETAEELGTVVKQGDAFVSTTTDMNGNVSDAFNSLTGFNDSLSHQWLTTNVLIEALKKYTDETTALGQSAYSAAQDVKTFSQLKDTLSEAVGSGWAETYEMIFGNFDEAKELWTWFSNTIGGLIGNSAEARKNVLQLWRDAEGREDLIAGIKDGVEGIIQIIKSIKMGIKDVFPSDVSDGLISFTRGFYNLMFQFKTNTKLFEAIRSITSGIVSSLKVGWNIAKTLFGFAWPVVKVIAGGLLKVWSFLSDIISLINSIIVDTGVLEKVTSGLYFVIDKFKLALSWIASKIKALFSFFKPKEVEEFGETVEETTEPLNDASETIEKATTRLEKFKATYEKIVNWFKTNEFIQGAWSGVKDVFNWILTSIKNFISGIKGEGNNLEKENIFTTIGTILKNAWDKAKSLFSNVVPNMNSVGDGLKSFFIKLKEAISLAKDGLLKFFGADSIFDLLKKFLELFVRFKFGKFLGGAGEMFEGIGKVGEISEAFANGITSITDSLKNFQKKQTSNLVKTIRAIGLLFVEIAASILIISLIPPGKVILATIVIGALMGLMVFLTKQMSNFVGSSKGLNAAKLLGINKIVLALGVSMATIAASVGKIAKISNKYGAGNTAMSLAVISGLMAVLTGAVILLTRFAKTDMDPSKMKKLIEATKSIASSIRTLGLVIAVLSLPIFDRDRIITSSIIVGILMTLLSGFVMLPRLLKNSDKTKITLLSTFISSISKAILMIGAVIAVLSLMNPQKVWSSALVVTAISAVLGGLALLTKIISGSNAKNVGTGMLLMASSIGILTLCMQKLGKMDILDVAKGLGVIASMFVLLGGAAFILSPIVPIVTALSAAMLLFGVGVLAFSIGVAKLSKAVKKFKGVNGDTVEGFIKMMDSLIGKLPEWTGKFISTIITTIFSMIDEIVEGVVEFIVKIITGVASNAETIISAIFDVIKVFMEKLNELASSIDIDYGNMVQILLVLGILGAIVFAVYYIGNNIKQAIIAVSAIVLVLAAIAGAVIAIDKLGSEHGDGGQKLIGIAGVILALAGAFAAISLMTSVVGQNGEGWKGMAIAIAGFLALILGIVGVIALIGWISSMIGAEDAESGLDNAIMVMNKVGEALGAFVSGFGTTIISAMSGVEDMIPALAVMALLIPAVGLVTPLLPIMVAFIAGIGGVMAALDEWFGEGTSDAYIKMIEKAAPVMEAVGTAIGSFVGGFAGGVLETINDAFINSIVNFGTGMSKFSEEIKPFFEMLKDVDGSTLEAALQLSGLILALTAAEILNGIASFFRGSSSLAEFGAELCSLAPYLSQYSNILNSGGFDARIVERSAVAARLLAAFADAIPKTGGVAQWFTGSPPKLGEFGSQLIDFGENLKTFGTTVSTITDEEFDAIDRSMPSLLKIIETVSKIPNSGGVAGFFAGENDADMFGKMLPELGKGLLDYGVYAEQLTPSMIDSIKSSVKAVGSIVDIADKIPNDGGLVTAFAGDNDISSFAPKLPILAEAVVDMATTLKDAPSGWVGFISSAARAIGNIIDLGNDLNGTGGLASLFYKEQDISDLPDILINLGDALSNFCTSTEGIDIKKVAPTAAALRTLINALAESDKLNKENAKIFSESIEGIAKSSIKNLINTFEGDNKSKAIGAAANFFGSIKAGCMNKSAEITKDIKNIIKDLANDIIDAIDNNQEDLNKKAAEVPTKMVEVLRTFTEDGNSFYNIGVNAVQGLINGMNSKVGDAQNAAFELGVAVYQSTKKGLDERSPSHIMENDVAFNAVEGLILGIRNRIKDAQNAGKDLGVATYDGTRMTLRGLADVIADGIDTNPVISPILDLSEVSRNSGMIGRMLSANTSIAYAQNDASLIAANRALNINEDITLDSKKIISAIDTIGSRLDSLEDAILSRPIELDGTTVSKVLADPLDKEFGRRSMYSRRGVR